MTTIQPQISTSESAKLSTRGTAGANRAGREDAAGEKFHSLLGKQMKPPVKKAARRETDEPRKEEKARDSEEKESATSDRAATLEAAPAPAPTTAAPLAFHPAATPKSNEAGASDDGKGTSGKGAPLAAVSAQGAGADADPVVNLTSAKVATGDETSATEETGSDSGAASGRFTIDPSLQSAAGAAVPDQLIQPLQTDPSEESGEAGQGVVPGEGGSPSPGVQGAGKAGSHAGPKGVEAFDLKLTPPTPEAAPKVNAPATSVIPTVFTQASGAGADAMSRAAASLIAGGEVRVAPSGESPKVKETSGVEAGAVMSVGQGRSVSVAAIAVAPAAEAPRIDPAHLLEQIVHEVRLQSRGGKSEMVMRLNPPDLGHIHIRLVSEGGTVTAQFHAESEAVRATLEAHLPQLQTALNDAGIAAQGFTVSTGAEFNGSGQGGASAYPEPSTAATRTGTAGVGPVAESPVSSSSAGWSNGAVNYLA